MRVVLGRYLVRISFANGDEPELGATVIYGREEEEWDCLEERGLRFLIERARMERTTSYTEFGRVISRQCDVRDFDFDLQSERTGVGYLLGRIVRRNRPESGVMLSALVIYLGENDAGSGFYKLAEEMEALAAGASEEQKTRFWNEQMQGAFDFYRPPRRER